MSQQVASTGSDTTPLLHLFFRESSTKGQGPQLTAKEGTLKAPGLGCGQLVVRTQSKVCVTPRSWLGRQCLGGEGAPPEPWSDSLLGPQGTAALAQGHLPSLHEPTVSHRGHRQLQPGAWVSGSWPLGSSELSLARPKNDPGTPSLTGSCS